ncbi:SDR family NAD(P)-dependent oxidoreductase [Aldersonia kunmingensis]|uniref:SDR family NAD(P)-dependent oxidoreductase n=1 Tax=Aldersonia kunmingensis TaxID=408066 RepID=UPI000831FD47|nr:SDR family NAD(P)-dependent oxidoreductase [Aldersonia kunmingensis]
MPNVLITGSARGIGRAAVHRLVAAGWDVWAGVRTAESGTALVEETGDRVHPVLLDITDAAQIAALDAALPAQLDAVVNNAGIAIGGPIEGIPLDELRRQFEVNLFGQVAVTQVVLERLRASHGRVVFVSSLSGRVSTAMTGAYNASKFALEGMADALRLEVAPWGIKVILVEPAQTDTAIWQDAESALDEAVASTTPAMRELYAGHIEGFRKSIPMSQKLAAPPETVAASIEKALTARRPRARYVVGTLPKIQSVAVGLTPTAVLDRVLGAATGVPRKL